MPENRLAPRNRAAAADLWSTPRTAICIASRLILRPTAVHSRKREPTLSHQGFRPEISNLKSQTSDRLQPKLSFQIKEPLRRQAQLPSTEEHRSVADRSIGFKNKILT
jgi:hypothetical protein